MSEADEIRMIHALSKDNQRLTIPVKFVLQGETMSEELKPCCDRDHNRDGNCDRHPASPDLGDEQLLREAKEALQTIVSYKEDYFHSDFWRKSVANPVIEKLTARLEEKKP